MNRDKYRIIGQIQSDGSIEGGDSVNWMGHWLYLDDEVNAAKESWNIDKYIKAFELGFGGYVRHFDPSQTDNGFGAYYKNPWRGVISRDQLIGILAALIKHRKLGPVLRLIFQHSLRLFLFSYNTIKNGEDPKMAKQKLPDPTLFDIWAMELRALGNAVKGLKYILYPILAVLDLQMLLSTLFYNKKGYTDISYAISLITSVENNSTFISRLTYKLCNKNKLLAALKKYWCGWRDNCEMYSLYENKLK